MMILNEYTLYRLKPKFDLNKMNTADSFKIIRNYARTVVCGFEVYIPLRYKKPVGNPLGVLEYKGNGIFTLDERFRSEFFNSSKDFFIDTQKIHLGISTDEPMAIYNIPLSAIPKDKIRWWIDRSLSDYGEVKSLEDLKKEAELRELMLSVSIPLRRYTKTPEQQKCILSQIAATIYLKMNIQFNSDFYEYYKAEGDSYSAARKTPFVKIT